MSINNQEFYDVSLLLEAEIPRDFLMMKSDFRKYLIETYGFEDKWYDDYHPVKE